MADFALKASLLAPNFLLKIIPRVDGTPRICELVEYRLEDVELKGAWTGPVVAATHILADLTLGLGIVVHDYLA
jgi:acetoacetate decarboxylase